MYRRLIVNKIQLIGNIKYYGISCTLHTPKVSCTMPNFAHLLNTIIIRSKPSYVLVIMILYYVCVLCQIIILRVVTC